MSGVIRRQGEFPGGNFLNNSAPAGMYNQLCSLKYICADGDSFEPPASAGQD